MKTIIATALVALSLPAHGQTSTSASSLVEQTGNGTTALAAVANGTGIASTGPVAATTGPLTVNAGTTGSKRPPVSSAVAASISGNTDCGPTESHALQLVIAGGSTSFKGDQHCDIRAYVALMDSLGLRKQGINLLCLVPMVRPAMGELCKGMPLPAPANVAAADDIEVADALGGD